MTILVTGGAGFVGVNLCTLLVDEGYSVRVLDDESLGKREYLGDLPVDFRKGSILDQDAVASSLDGVEGVVHLAADTRVMDSIENPAKNFQANVVGTFVVLEEMRRAGVRNIVAASSGGAILGEVPCPVNEEVVARPVSPYGASKLAMEGYMSAYAGAYGFRCAALRFSNVYGPRSFHKGSVVATFFRNILGGKPLTVYGDGEQIRDYVFSGDLVGGILAALKGDASGVYQLGTGIPTTLNQLIDNIRKTVGGNHPFEVNFADARDGEIINTYCNIDKARTDFSYAANTCLSDGLTKTWEWFLKSYHSDSFTD